MNRLNTKTIQDYIQKLHDRGESSSGIKQKKTSIKKFLDWLKIKGYVNELDFNEMNKALRSPNNKELSFPRMWKSRLKSLLKNVIDRLATIKSKDKETLPTLQYVGLIIILIFIAVMGAGIYNQFFVKNRQSLAYPTTLTKAGRILSFQGRLTDTLSNPITTATNVVFQLYSVSSGGIALYTTGACSVTPDQDGIFNSLIGSDCGAEIASSVFSENVSVYLGVTVGADAEMTPRQQIANVGYAINSETLQGLPPGSNVSNIPYINVDGNLLIAASNPNLASTYASSTFTISSAQATTIQSAGTGDIVLQATESGTLKFRTGGTTDANTRITVDNAGLVGIGTTSPAATALLDLTSTTKGFLAPRMTTTERDAIVSPATGLMIYNTTTNQYNVFDGTVWGAVGGGGVGAWSDLTDPTANLALTMGAYTSTFTYNATTGASNLFNLTDTLNNTGTGYLLNLTTASGSTLKPFHVSAAGTEALTVLANGSVGIGNAAPGTALDITGTGRFSSGLTLTTGALNLTGTSGVLALSGLSASSINTGANNITFTSGNFNTTATGINGTAIGATTPSTGAFTTLSSTGNTTLGDASGDTVTANADAWTFANDTNFALTGGVNGLSFDTNTLSIDATSDRVGIGTTTPGYLLDVAGIAAANYFVDNTNSAYGFDPAGTTNFGGYSLKTTGGALLAVDSGNVGIGATSPVGKLDITDTSNTAASLSLTNNTTTTIGAGIDTLGVLDLQSTSLTTGNFLNIETNALTSGKGLNLTSTSVGLTTGNLGSFDWSPSSATTATGDLLSLNIGTNGNIGNLFNVKDTSSSLFSVSETAVTSNLPTLFTSSGDVSIAYDLVFTNQTSSNIQSYGPLTITSGESFENNNLTLKTYGTGDVVFDSPGGLTLTQAQAWNLADASTTSLNIESGLLNFDTTNSRVGIGTTTPGYLLDVAGIAAANYFVDNTNSAYGFDPAGTTNFGGYSLKTTGGALLAVDSGNVGIGATSPVGKLDITDTSNTAASLSLTNNTTTTIGAGIDTLGVLDLQSTSLTTGNFLNIETNALTSGKGLNLTSTSVGLTGDLANITASGSNAGVTGSVLKVGLTGASAVGTALNVTTAGASGFALRVNDDGTYTDSTPFVVDYAGNVGIGTTGPTGKLDIQGTTAMDLPTYSAEFLSGSGWTSTDWTGDWATGWAHTTGNTTVLSQSTAAVNATKYQIAYTVTNRTAGSFTIGFGGVTSTTITATGAWGPTTSSTASLTITPTTDFNGTIVISIKSITAISTPLVNLRSSDGTARIEMRANTGTSNTFIGNGAGRYNTTGYWNSAMGVGALLSNTTGYNNTAIGMNSLYFNTTGYSNTAIGMNSLYNNTTGSGNNAMGINSLQSNTTGYDNSAQGAYSLYANTTGFSNAAMGRSALYNNTTGSNNSAQGAYSLVSNTTGYQNSTQGYYSLYNLRPTSKAISAFSDYGGTVAGTVRATSAAHGLTGTSNKQISGTVNYNGSKSITVIDVDSFYFTATWVATETGWWAIDSEGRYNTAVGTNAGRTLITGDSNTFLGYGAGYHASQLTTAQNSMALGNGTYTTASNQIVIGNTAITQTLLNGNVGIGTTSPLSKLHVSGDTLTIGTATDNATRSILFTTTGGGTSEIKSITNGATNQALTFSTTYATSGERMRIDGQGNVGIGDTTPDALLDLDSIVTTTANFGITNTGIYTGTGTNSVAQISANSATSGDILHISATGATSGSALVINGPTTTGVTDNFVKIFADVGSGASVLTVSPDFSGNAVQSYGLVVNATDTTSNANVDMAQLSAITLSGNAAKAAYGSYNQLITNSTIGDTIIGYQSYLLSNANAIMTTGNRTIVGYTSSPNSISANTGGNTNIYGVQSFPSSTLATTGSSTNVFGLSTSTTGTLTTDGTLNQYGVYIGNGTSSTVGNTQKFGLYVEAQTGADNNVAATFMGGGVGIGVQFPTVALDVLAAGTGVIAKFNSANTTGCTLATGGTITCTSDRRLKKDIEEIGLGLDTVMTLDPVTFNWKNQENPFKSLGFISQDVERILPSLVITDTETGYKQLNSIGIIPILTKAIQELNTKIVNLSLTSEGDVAIQNVNQTAYVYDGSPDTQYQISKIKDQNYILNIKNQAVVRIGAFSEIIVAKIKSGFIETESIIVNNTLIVKNILTNKINVSEKIISPIVETTSLTAQTAQINKVSTNEIKPAEKDILFDISNESNMSNGSNPGSLAKLIIKGLEGKSAVVIDASGNASFSGQIIADSLIINNDTTVAGTLVAKEIQSENINSLTKTVFNQRQSLTDQSTSINDIQKLLADIKNQPLPNLTNETNLSNVSNNFESLTVTGQSNLYSVSVSNSLLVGTTLMDQNSIISLASELKLSALSTINLFDGAVVIARNGKITTTGEIIAQGGIRTNEIKSLIDDGQVLIDNLTINNLTFDQISTNSAVIAAADNFDINGIFAPAIEAATASAGLGILPANQSEVIIYNDRVNTDSLIYLTLTSTSPTNTQLTVVKKESTGKPYFKIAVDNTIDKDIKFNWLIIN